MSFSSGGRDYKVVHANGSAGSVNVAAEGYTVVLDTLGKLSGQTDQIAAEKYQTIILVK